MSDWTLFSTGLPPVDVRELEIFYDPIGTQHRIKAATYGRGLWQSDLIETGVLNLLLLQRQQSVKAILLWAGISTRAVTMWCLHTTQPPLLALQSTDFLRCILDNSRRRNSYFQWGATSFDHTSLAISTTYYYKLWSYNGSTVYSNRNHCKCHYILLSDSTFPWSEGFEIPEACPHAGHRNWSPGPQTGRCKHRESMEILPVHIREPILQGLASIVILIL